MQVIITIAGLGQRFKSEGHDVPKPLVSVMGKPAISYLISCMNPEWNLFFAIGEHYKNSQLEKVIKKLSPRAQIFYVPYSERGPIDTVSAVLHKLNSDQAVAVSYCDYWMLWDSDYFEKFLQDMNCDICIPSYQGFHPTYLGPNSYAHLKVNSETDEVQKIQEKQLFGKNIQQEWTSTGFYYFKSVELLKKGLQLQLQKKLKYGNEFYTSLAAQALLDDSVPAAVTPRIMNYKISHFMQLGTPTDVALVEHWFKFIQIDMRKNEFEPNSEQNKLYHYWQTVFKKLF